MPTHALLDGFPIVVEIPVAWGDMDAFGHVNKTVFFRYFETARIAFLFRVDFRGDDGGPGPILASTHCRFRRPLEFPDTVLVGVRVTELGEDRFTHEYRIVSIKSNEVAADGGGVVVAYDYGSKSKAAIPARVREAIEGL
jgi:acyl-CoA thioester hydrolase